MSTILETLKLSPATPADERQVASEGLLALATSLATETKCTSFPAMLAVVRQWKESAAALDRLLSITKAATPENALAAVLSWRDSHDATGENALAAVLDREGHKRVPASARADFLQIGRTMGIDAMRRQVAMMPRYDGPGRVESAAPATSVIDPALAAAMKSLNLTPQDLKDAEAALADDTR